METDTPTPRGYRAFLRARRDDTTIGSEQLHYRVDAFFQPFKVFMLRVQALGLTPKELEISKQYVASSFAIPGLGAQDLITVIEGR